MLDLQTKSRGGPKKYNDPSRNRAIQPGDSGIWVTCDKGREGKCTAELKDLFNTVSSESITNAVVAEPGERKGKLIHLRL